ncbi:MAG: adenosylmethionine--8-amino-7-oxononanoate transaminase [Verrucomicrobia bacterium]|nr:adenosylmethionine--8-amino-7-oxononanoate transaminase [Verrucomicrobiota bacterium]
MTPTEIAQIDQQHLWHPFTPNSLWLDPDHPPLSIASGEGAWLTASDGRRYLDGNSSIWTNLHGHAHPKINQAIKSQLDRIAHSSFLGLTHEPAVQLAQQLLRYTRLSSESPNLNRVFFSDDGSTAIEAGLKMILQSYAQNGQRQRTQFISPQGAYHGDTVGAMSLSHSPTFHHHFQPVLFPTQKVMTPACYRCPFNRAKPEQADARSYRKCNFECASMAEEAIEHAGDRLAAWVLEPRVQGAAGMVMHPHGYAKRTAISARKVGAKVFFDEVLTAFGRTGTSLASHAEEVVPDVLALAKGLTGGYLPLAATLTTEEIFQSFSGNINRTFFHGHSYTANPLGCAAASASLDLLESSEEIKKRERLVQNLSTLSSTFWKHPYVGDVRQEGAILAIELVADRATRTPFQSEKRLGAKICHTARKFGLITRPIRDVLVLMPPYCTRPEELEKMVHALHQAITQELGS